MLTAFLLITSPVYPNAHAGEGGGEATDLLTENRHPPGSYARALELWEGLRNFQFTVEVTEANGRRRTYAGERVQRNGQTIIHVRISGAGRDQDGEWWFRLGNNPFDNGQRVYLKERGNWVRMKSPPDTEMIIPAGGTVSPLLAANQTLVGTETLSGQTCQRYRRTDAGVGVTDTWISTTNGYGIRKRFQDTHGNVTVNDIARPNEDIQIETPAGAE
jgi:hypothetical protein